MANDLARWQSATTSIYHFLFVPLTIGLAFRGHKRPDRAVIPRTERLEPVDRVITLSEDRWTTVPSGPDLTIP